MSRSTFGLRRGPSAAARLAGLLVTMVLVAACSDSGLASRVSRSAGPAAAARTMPSSTSVRVSPAAPARAPDHLPVAWRSRGFHPVSTPKVEGKTVLVYGTIGKYLYLFALDSTTGAQRWYEHASTGDQPPGISPDVDVIDHDVVFFRPEDAKNDPYWAQLVRVDPLTGVDIAASEPMYWDSDPQACGAGGHSVCLPGSDDAGPVTSWMFTRTGALLARPGGSQYRDLGAGVVDLLARNPEKIAHQDSSGRVVWSKPLAALFGPGVTTDAGWDFAQVGAHIVVGSVYHWDHAAEKTRIAHTDLATDVSTAAFDPRTGVLLWRRRGVSNDCYFSLFVYSADTMAPLRCAYTGRFVATYPQHGKPTLQAKAVGVSLQRYDPRTGRTAWSLPLGNVAALYGEGTDDALIPLLDQTHALVPRGSSRVVVDLATGAFHATTPRDVFWCQPTVTFAQSPTKDDGGFGTTARESNGLVTMCSAQGRPVATGAVRVPASFGVAIGRLTLVSTPSSVVAYRPR